MRVDSEYRVECDGGLSETEATTLPDAVRPAELDTPSTDRLGPVTTRRTPLRGTTVLVVEDDEDHRELAQQMLTALGARVLVAEDGREALRVLATESVDLVLCDLLMPMIDGFEFARRVRASPRHQHLRLVAMTALDRPNDFLRTQAAGFDAHLAKPFTFEQLDDLGRLINQAEPDIPQASFGDQPPA